MRFSEEELEGMSALRAMRNRVTDVIGCNPTVRDFLNITRRGRAPGSGGQRQGHRRPTQTMFVERASDGFVVAATHLPGAFEDFVRLVIPELQRGALYHREYEGLTLRENLGLGLPQPGWWK